MALFLDDRWFKSPEAVKDGGLNGRDRKQNFKEEQNKEKLNFLLLVKIKFVCFVPLLFCSRSSSSSTARKVFLFRKPEASGATGRRNVPVMGS